ncbi:hypothetical protein ATE47_01640 [Chryseobacterium sp. IHB B 17019]|uniref:hypothetical protein n=1 Tax=Chryseobacterium sp. IHB B 17019 TaxID=1721091 RepID=UPI000720A9B2|nr:hypothetical protein [Chryseobacterium sp. IHB B 17019]ALR29314.1 hypothetical protein ATE47_01640 [Chryseobacterium sp. IHB B 17019]
MKTMEHKKIINHFNKQINKTKKEGVSRGEIEQYYDLIKQSIEDDIKEGFKETIARNLTLGIGVHSGEYPKHLILNGETNGWKYITRYLLWQQHILQQLFNYKEVTPRSIGPIIALAVLWGMSELARSSRNYFQLLFEDNREKYKKSETHHLFIAILYDLKETKSINQQLYSAFPEENIYKRFLDNWSTADAGLLSELLFELCDFHLYSAMDLKNKFSEILSLDYIPYEIRLIEKIRDEQGLINVKIDHPLMKSQLADIPVSAYGWDLSNDEVYQFLIRRE